MTAFFDPTRFNARKAVLFIAAMTAVKLVVALFFPATIDEAYGIVVSRQWSLSYFDHPPLAFTIARLTAWLADTEVIWLIRLPFIAMGAVSAWLMYRITDRLFGTQAAFWALSWFLVAPFFFISAGHFVVPDGPLNLALLAAFFCFVPVLLAQGAHTSMWKPWLGFGFFLAVALTAKYQAVLFGLGILIFLLLTPLGRAQLKTLPPWIAALIAALGLLPMVAWNVQNEFVSFSFQSGRATQEFGLQPTNFLITMLGQAIYLLPGTFLVALIVTARSLSAKADNAQRALAMIVCFHFLIFAFIAAISVRSLPHWPMPGFLFAFPLVGKWSAENAAKFSLALPRSLYASIIGIPTLALLVALQLGTSAFTRSISDEKTALDPDWRDGSLANVEQLTSSLNPQEPIYVRNWSRAGKLAHAIGPAYSVVPLNDPRHFQFADAPGGDGAFIGFFGVGTSIQDASRFAETQLKNADLAIVGDATFVPMKAGELIKFYALKVNVEKK